MRTWRRSCAPSALRVINRTGDGPFPLETFDQVRRRASLIVQVTAKGYMPPWKPSSDSPAFVGDRRLSADEKSLIKRWLDAGLPEGRSRAGAPAAPVDDDGVGVGIARRDHLAARVCASCRVD